MKKERSFRLLLGLAIMITICGFVTVFNPGIFWRMMNILLGIALIFSGISAIINAIKNQHTQYVTILFINGILILILGFMLVLARDSNFIGTLMIWMFALWAFIRGCMLLFFGIQNRETHPLRWAILTLGIILVILSITTAISSGLTDSLANLVGICIGISIIFDGLSLLFFVFRSSGTKSIQAEIIDQANQKEIAQSETIITNDFENNQEN